MKTLQIDSIMSPHCLDENFLLCKTGGASPLASSKQRNTFRDNRYLYRWTSMNDMLWDSCRMITEQCLCRCMLAVRGQVQEHGITNG